MTEPLWRPSRSASPRANLTPLRRQVGPAGRLGYGPLYRWSIAEPEAFWRALWDFGGVVGERGRGPALSPWQDARRALVPEARLNFAENLLRRRDARRRDRLLGRGQVKRRADLAPSSTTRCRALAQALRARGRARRRPRRRLHAQHAGDRSSPCSRPPASAPSGRRARPISACRACSTASARSSRRCCSRADGYCYTARRIDSLAARRARSCRSCRRVERVVVVPYSRAAPTLGDVPNARALDDFIAPLRAGADRVRAAAVRPSALHPVFLGHHRRAEVHRARRRRHAAAAPEGAPAAQRRASRGDRAVLLHHLRLDDVELAGLGARVRTRRCCSTTARRSIRDGRMLFDFADAERMTHLRHLGQVHRRAARKAGARADARRTSSRALRTIALDRLAARAGELRLRLRRT